MISGVRTQMLQYVLFIDPKSVTTKPLQMCTYRQIMT